MGVSYKARGIKQEGEEQVTDTFCMKFSKACGSVVG
jgi:hypothetical protein